MNARLIHHLNGAGYLEGVGGSDEYERDGQVRLSTRILACLLLALECDDEARALTPRKAPFSEKAMTVSDTPEAQIAATTDDERMAAFRAMLVPPPTDCNAPDRDVHTEHCCKKHGCKYGNYDGKCTVKSGEKMQSYLCVECHDDNADFDDLRFLLDRCEALGKENAELLAKNERDARSDEALFMANNKVQEDRIRLWRERCEELTARVAALSEDLDAIGEQNAWHINHVGWTHASHDGARVYATMREALDAYRAARSAAPEHHKEP